MRSQIVYEWCCEYVDDFGDIQDHEWSDKFNEVWPPIRSVDDCSPRLCLVRMAGNDEEGEVDRGYAYAEEGRFSCGHKVPARFISSLCRDT